MTLKVTRPVLRWHGGKWRIAPWIISHFPEHDVYIEPFGGAGSVLLRKPRVGNEIYNDLNKEVVNLFQIMRDPARAAELANMVRFTPFAREEFINAYDPAVDSIERARRMIARCYMGYGGECNASATATGFRTNMKNTRQSPAGDLMTWPDKLKSVTERLRGVMIENKDALDLMQKFDGEETLHYVDPPYVHSTRNKRRRKAYSHELSDDDHKKLAKVLKRLKGMVILSGYPNDLYKKLYRGWHIKTKKTRTNGNQKRTEAIWINESGMKKHEPLFL